MKKNLQIIYILTLIVFIACNTNNNENKVESKMLLTDTTQTVKSVKKFADIQFASRYDTTCRMPISAGIEDTLLLNGKVYGFCSTECKDEFVTTLKKQHKR